MVARVARRRAFGCVAGKQGRGAASRKALSDAAVTARVAGAWRAGARRAFAVGATARTGALEGGRVTAAARAPTLDGRGAGSSRGASILGPPRDQMLTTQPMRAPIRHSAAKKACPSARRCVHRAPCRLRRAPASVPLPTRAQKRSRRNAGSCRLPTRIPTRSRTSTSSLRRSFAPRSSRRMRGNRFQPPARASRREPRSLGRYRRPKTST